MNMRMCSFQLTVILFSHFSQHFPQLTITCKTHHITYQINYVIMYYRRIQQRKNILNNNMHGNMETGEEDTRQPQMIISLICATILIYCTTLYIDAASIHDHTVI